MSKAWSEKNKLAERPGLQGEGRDLRLAQRQRHRPLHLKSWEPDKRIVFAANKDWWDKPEGNVTDVIYTPIKSDETRVSALLSGEVDLVTDLPTQDVARLRNDAEAQDPRRRRGAHHLHRHGPAQRRAPVLERQGQEPVQGHARAEGAEHGGRPRGDQARSPCAACRCRRASWSRRACTATPTELDKPPEVRRRRREEAARRGRLPERLRVHARLPEQPLRQRREDLPGAGRRCGREIGLKVQAQRDAVRQLHPEDPELRHERLHARLGRGRPSTRCYTLQSLVRTKTTGADGSFNLGRISDPKLDNIDRRDQDRDRPGEARRAAAGSPG